MFRLALFLLLSASSLAFVPQQGRLHQTTDLAALNRRDALGFAFSAMIGAASTLPTEAEAVSNPALETFKGGKKTKGAYIPGKGLRNGQTYDELVAVSNPALETFKGRKATKGSFIPGKGMRNTAAFDELVAVSNPALETFKGRKATKGSFIPQIRL